MKKISLFAVLFLCTLSLSAQTENLPLTVKVEVANLEDPYSTTVKTQMANKLEQMLAGQGITSSDKNDHFVLTVSMIPQDKEVLPGPPFQMIEHIHVKYAIMDATQKNVLATCEQTVKGMGRDQARVYMDAIKHMNITSPAINTFIQEGKEKIAVWTTTNRVIAWQKAAYPTMNEQRIWKAEGDLSWENAIYLSATAQWANFTNNDLLRNWCQFLADTNHYAVQQSYGMYHADELVIGSMYAQLFKHSGDSAVLQPMYERFRYLVEHPVAGWIRYSESEESKSHWTWCDALYMAPAAMAEYATLFNDQQLLNYMDTEFHACYDHLYSPADSLFYRDERYIGQKEANGKPVFWGRGNGWVLGGLARTIPLLPDTMDKSWYIDLYRQMALRVIRVQHPDGYWRASMLDTESYPNKEMSCTTLFAFALWWGINAGILSPEEALEPAMKAWKAIEACVHDNGMLGNVQPVGENPKAVTADMTEVYGPALMALTAEEMIRYKSKK